MEYNPDNPIIAILRNNQMTPEMLSVIAHRQGYENINDFLGYFEPKAQAVEVDSGTGNGDTATEVEHYIDMTPNHAGNPQQHYMNDYRV